MIATDDETRLIRALYADAALPGAFAGFRALLAERTGAQSAAMVIARDPVPVIAAMPGDPMPGALLAAPAMRRERVYTPGEIPALPDAPFRALRLRSDAGGDVWLSIWRPARDFRATDSTLLTRLGPHLAQAVAMWLDLGPQRTMAQASARLLAARGIAPLWFDAQGRVARFSRPARDLLAGLPGWAQGTDGRPIAPEAVARTLRATPRPQITLLARAPLTVLALDTTGPDAEGLTRAAVSRAPDPAGIDARILAQSLGLEPNEARLAIAIACGASLAEAAQTHGWTEGTARSYAKRAYARLGLRSQADLARLVLSGLWGLD